MGTLKDTSQQPTESLCVYGTRGGGGPPRPEPENPAGPYNIGELCIYILVASDDHRLGGLGQKT